MTIKYLSDSEVLTVAMNMEDEGYKFYAEAARVSKNKETRNVFEKLMEDESEHFRVFKDMLDSISGKDSSDYFGITDDMASYLRVLIETGVFKTMDKDLFRKMKEVEALEIAVRTEQDAVLFYTGAGTSSVNPKAREVMSNIAQIEKEHIVLLTNRLRRARRLF